MSDEDLNVVEFQSLGSYQPNIYIEGEGYENGDERLYPDESLAPFYQAVDEAIREEFSEHIERLKGDYDKIIIREVVIDSGDVPKIKYAVANEKK